MRVPSSSTDSLKLLLAGRADMAVVDIHDLGLARERGEDIVGRRRAGPAPAGGGDRASPRSSARATSRASGWASPGCPSDDAVLRAVVEHDGGDYSKVKRTTIGFTAVPSLIAGKVDAVVAFWNAEGVALRAARRATREFRVDDYGAPRYPELVLAVRGADLAGAARRASRRRWAACATTRSSRCATARRRSTRSSRPRAPTRR